LHSSQGFWDWPPARSSDGGRGDERARGDYADMVRYLKITKRLPNER